jgi:hypothetical protein
LPGARSWGAALIAWDAAPSPSRNGAQKRKYVTQITDGRGAASYIDDNRHTRWEHVMTWTSDRAGVVFYTVLGTLIVLSSIYIPA